MTGAKAKSDPLNTIWRAWGMKQQDAEAKAQRQALAAIGTYLRSGPAATLRGMQSVLVDPDQPEASKRPLFGPLWAATEDHWAAVGTGDGDVMLMQALLLAAKWPQGQAGSALAPTLLSPWMGVAGRKRQRKELEQWRAERAVEKTVGEREGRIGSLVTMETPKIATLEHIASMSVQKHIVAIRLNNLQNSSVLNITAYNDILEVIKSGITELHENILNFHNEARTSVNQVYKFVIEQTKTSDVQEYLWWGQARYCHTLRKPFRRIDDLQQKIWLAATEAAERASALPVEPSASYLQEVLHALGVPLHEARPLSEHLEQLRALLGEMDRPQVPASLASLLTEDAFGVPVSLLCADPKISDDRVIAQLGLPPDTMLDLGDWSAWVFRELVFLRRWSEQS